MIAYLKKLYNELLVEKTKLGADLQTIDKNLRDVEQKLVDLERTDRGQDNKPGEKAGNGREFLRRATKEN